MWKVTKEAGIPIYRSIMQLIIQKIQQGDLLPGEKLPPERTLAEKLGVNRSTVVHALDELAADGVVIRRQGSGTQVNEGKWGLTLEARTDWHQYLSHAMLSPKNAYQQKIEQILKGPACAEYLDLYTGELPLDLIPSFSLPMGSWKDFLNEEKHQDELGYLPLRAAISRRLAEKFALDILPKELLITSGAQQALLLLIQSLLSQGDAVAIEDPSFFYALPIFQAAGIRLFAVPLDDEGIDLAALEHVILKHRVKMVLVNPNFQNPTGKLMSLLRRKNLVELCRKFALPIVEDDAFNELYFSAAPLPTLKSLAPDSVLYVGSFSKTLGATTKIGWLAAPRPVIQKLADARQLMDQEVSVFPQVLAAMALNDPTFEQKVVQLRQRLKTRAAGAAAVCRTFSHWHFYTPAGGYYLWLFQKSGRLTPVQMEQAVDCRLLVAPSYHFGTIRRAIRLNFARIAPDQLPTFKERMQQLLTLWDQTGRN